MLITIDSAGRIVIPKRLRERFGLTAGTPVELDQVGDHLEIRLAGRHVRIEMVEGRPLARADGDAPTLTVEEVRRLLEGERL